MAIQASAIEFAKKRHKFVHFCLLFFLLSLPFQYSLYQHFWRLASALTPPDIPYPWAFCRQILFYTTDVLFLLFLLVALVSVKVPWRLCFWKGGAKYLVFYLMAAFLSLDSRLFACMPFIPLQYVKLLQHAFPLLLFCLLPYCFDVSSYSSFLLRLFWGLFVVGVVQSLFAIFQYIFQEPLGFTLLGEQMESSTFPSTFFHFGNRTHIRRAAGTMGHANVLGQFLFFTLMISCALFQSTVKKKRVFLVIFGIVLQVFALLVSFSRGALGAAALGVVVYLWCMRRHLVDGLKRWKKGAIFPVVSLVALAAVCIASLAPALGARGFLTGNATIRDSLNERLVYQEIALEMIKAHPMLGVGFNNFQLAKRHFDFHHQAHTFNQKVHNIFLVVGSEIGLLGLAAFLLFLVAVLKNGMRTPMTPFHASLLAAFVGLLFTAFFDPALFAFNNMMFVFFTVCALLSIPAKFQEKIDET